MSEAALDDLWRQLGLLHRGRIAHRSLTLPNLVLDGDSAWLTGLENARLVAGDDSRALDVAELLVSTTLVVGVERAIAAAVRVADHDELTACLAFIQPPALPPQTRKAAKKPKGLITEIRTGLQTALGVDAVELAELERISIPKLLTWVGFVVLAYFLLSLASSWSEISDAMAGLNWWWVVPILAVTLTGTVASAVTMMGSVLRPLPLGDTTIVMFGQSFLNRFTPMNAGGMAMRIRYLQKGGTDATVATAAVGLTSAASGVMQVLFITFFLLWSSTDPTDDTQGADAGSSSDGVAGTVIVVVAIAVVLAILVFAFTPKLRRWLIDFVKSTISKIRHDFGELARQPTKLLMLFGGAGAGKMCTIIAFVLSCSRLRHRPVVRRARRLVHDRQHRGLHRAHTRRRRGDRCGPRARADERRSRPGHRVGGDPAVPGDQLLVPDDPRLLRPQAERTPRTHLTLRSPPTQPEICPDRPAQRADPGTFPRSGNISGSTRTVRA